MKVNLKLSKAPKNKAESFPLLEYENRAHEQGYSRVAGIDEAGRGPLAGPVVAAVCLIDKGIVFDGINDSKQLTPLKRQEFYFKLTSHPAVSYGLGIVEPVIIDSINIYQATLEAMKESVRNMIPKPDYLLVDGVQLSYPGIDSLKIIKGDTLSQSIAAASILAKVTRDRLMEQFHQLYPHYSFHEHKGYGTAKHKAALKIHGPCPIHRKSFKWGL